MLDFLKHYFHFVSIILAILSLSPLLSRLLLCCWDFLKAQFYAAFSTLSTLPTPGQSHLIFSQKPFFFFFFFHLASKTMPASGALVLTALPQALVLVTAHLLKLSMLGTPVPLRPFLQGDSLPWWCLTFIHPVQTSSLNMTCILHV